MPLVGHLRELRTRTTRGMAAIVLGTVVAWFAYGPILDFLTHPYTEIQPLLKAQGITSDIVITGIGGAFQFQLKISLVAGILLSSPAWLWQMWAFVLPAMHRHEKRWAILLTSVGAPLFVAGAVLAYVVLPKALAVLIGFVPDGFSSLVTSAEYLDFIVRMSLVFGIAAEIPLVVVVLNRIGAVSAQQLARARPWTVLAIFVFSAIATPTTDPLTMLLLALPMLALYLLSEVVAALTDRRRSSSQDELPDDAISSIHD